MPSRRRGLNAYREYLSQLPRWFTVLWVSVEIFIIWISLVEGVPFIGFLAVCFMQGQAYQAYRAGL